MSQSPSENPTERLVRIGRRSLYLLLILILMFGATLVAVLTSPNGAVAKFFERAPWALPIMIILFVGIQRTAMGGKQWDPRSPEVKALLNDELRRVSFDRASRVAFFVTLFLQVPLALAIDTLAPPHALMTMAVANMTLSTATMLVLFLLFDRE